MTKSPKKQRLSVYLEPDVMKALAAHAARRGHSLSLVAEALHPSCRPTLLNVRRRR